jgi:hypothetical protein
MEEFGVHLTNLKSGEEPFPEVFEHGTRLRADVWIGPPPSDDHRVRDDGLLRLPDGEAPPAVLVRDDGLLRLPAGEAPPAVLVRDDLLRVPGGEAPPRVLFRDDLLRVPGGEAPPRVLFRDDLLRLPAGEAPPRVLFRDDLLRVPGGEEPPRVLVRDDLLRVPGGEAPPRVLVRDDLLRWQAGEALPPVELRDDLLRTQIPEPSLVVDTGFTDGSKWQGTEYGTEGDTSHPIESDANQFDKNPLPELGISDQRLLSYKDGTHGSLTLRRELSAPEVDQFTSADGVKYRRVDLNAEDRAILADKLGHEPPPGLSAWVVEGGGIGKSNGNSDRKIIASISFDEAKNSVNVKTVWPVPQETTYNGDGSFVHSFPNGVKRTTRFGPGGEKSLTQEWPGSSKERTIVTSKDGEQKISDRDKTK